MLRSWHTKPMAINTRAGARALGTSGRDFPSVAQAATAAGLLLLRSGQRNPEATIARGAVACTRRVAGHHAVGRDVGVSSPRHGVSALRTGVRLTRDCRPTTGYVSASAARTPSALRGTL